MLKYPENGGTVNFIDKQFGNGLFPGSINNLLWISYIVMLALYASAFGSYASQLVSITGKTIDVYLLQSAIIIIALLINYLSIKLVGAIESISVVIKLAILLVFVGIGFYGFTANPENLNQLQPANWENPFLLIAGGMVIFVAYEGFELIANSIGDLKNREKNTEKVYFGAVGFVMILYILIAIVTVGSVTFAEIASAEDYVLAKAAEPMLGQTGFKIIALTAVISTFSAINATILGSSRVNFEIAKEHELPQYFCHTFLGKPVGLLITAILSLVLVNTIDLKSISTAGSSGFLLIFAIVNFVGYKKYEMLNSKKTVHLAGVVLCSIAFITLIVQQSGSNIKGVLISLGIIAFSFFIEFTYQKYLLKK